MKLKLLPLFLILSIINFSYAQIDFEDQVIIDNTFTSDNATSVFAADIDGDGDLDVLSSDLFADEIAWYENLDGQGNFSIKKIIASELNQCFRVFASDLDGDGDMDAIAVYASSSRISWFENLDGQGNFGLEKEIALSTASSGILDVADIDGDGDMDIISGKALGDNVVWYENEDGLGNFGDKQIVTTDAADVTSVFAADIDGDNDIDLLSTSNGDSKIAWYENLNGQGNFGTQQIITNNADDPRFVTTEDLDGDGDMDILSGYYDGDMLVWFENTNGQGSFSAQQIISDETNGITSATAADVDNDGDMDVISTSTIGWDVAWYENQDGQGSFGAKQLIDDNARQVNKVFVVDLDNDSNVDIITSAQWQPGVAWYKNLDGLGSFEAVRPITTDAKEAQAVASTDLDGDGDLDVVSASLAGNTPDDKGEIAWYENTDGEGAFGVQDVIANPEGVRYITLSDMDGDGDDDIIFSAFSEPNLGWIENTGQGTFSSTQDTIVVEFPQQKIMHPADLDGDGDFDILTVFLDGNFREIVWYENIDGLGNFDPAQVVDLPPTVPNEVFPSDIDGDGDLDIIFTSENSVFENRIGWLENTDGQGNFGPQQLFSENDVRGANHIQTADIDGDGDLDVFLGTSANPTFRLMWFENMDGLGTFADEQIITLDADWIFGIAAADIDDDGDIDIATSSDDPTDDDEIVWYENTDGLGVFGPKQIVSTNVSNVKSIHAADLDQDGDPDLLSASYNTSSIVFHKNLSLRTNEIKGTIRVDGDGNGCDASDLAIANMMVTIDDGTDELGTFSLSNGFYQFFPEIGTITTSLTAPQYYSVSPESNTSIFTDVGNRDTVDFCLEPTQNINDLNITIYPLTDARPGFDAEYQIAYTNMGTEIVSGTLEVNFDNSKVSFLNASEVLNSPTDSTLTFDYINLRPFETKTVNLNFNVSPPPIVNLSDILIFKTTIDPVVDDNTVEDNEFILGQIVIGSFDPNDIRVLEGDSVLIENAAEYLHYIIRFQNTGTASAINVIVENTLDPNLDWNTFQIETYSHDNRVEINDGNKIAFIFNEIYLPDSTSNEPESHGFITYKIKPKTDIAIGDIVSNKADIFFDFNEAIETNIVTTEFVEIDMSSAVKELDLLDFSTYPVPVKDILSVRSKTKIIQIELYNNQGKLVLRNSNQNQIDISSLNPGIYYCKILDGSRNYGIRKIVKE